jgi:hypothetical protein
MFKLFNLLTILQVSSSTLIYNTMKDCSSAVHTGHIISISMIPPAPVSGSYVNIVIDYTLDTDVTDGLATYTASFNGFPLSPTTEPLCPDLEDTTTPCPISAGNIHFEGISQIGDGNTHGTIVATTTWKDQNGNEIICWGFSVRI